MIIHLHCSQNVQLISKKLLHVIIYFVQLLCREFMGQESTQINVINSRDYWKLLEYTGDYRSTQEITGVHWRLLEISGVHWSTLEITGNYWRLLDWRTTV